MERTKVARRSAIDIAVIREKEPALLPLLPEPSPMHCPRKFIDDAEEAWRFASPARVQVKP